MDFKFATNRAVSRVKLKELSGNASVKISRIYFRSASYKAIEDTLKNGEVQNDKNIIIIDEMELQLSEFKKLKFGERYHMECCGFMEIPSGIYAYQLELGNISFESMKKTDRNGEHITVYHIEMKMWPCGEYSSRLME